MRTVQFEGSDRGKFQGTEDAADCMHAAYFELLPTGKYRADVCGSQGSRKDTGTMNMLACFKGGLDASSFRAND